MKYNYTEHYRKMKKKIDRNYGEVHLCGNCKHMTRCIRNEIQWLNNKKVKATLMELKAPFVKRFEVEPMPTYGNDRGFVTVYDCERYEFEGYEGDADGTKEA